MPYVHFKMETLSSVLNLITPGCYLAPINLKNAYYSVSTHTDYTKCLKFSGKDSYINFWSFLMVCIVGQENLQS